LATFPVRLIVNIYQLVLLLDEHLPASDGSWVVLGRFSWGLLQVEVPLDREHSSMLNIR
jgi:hypothetical protein